MNASVRILIVDDHREIREVIAQVLSNEGFAVTVAADGGAMRRSLQDRKIDLVILDLMLPGEDGLSLCRELRTMMPTLPVIMVTAKGEEVDRVVGLEVGADDYVTKPFSSRELVARIKAVLRRARPPAARPLEVRSYRFAGWRLNTLSRNLESPEGVVVPLSTSEFQLLLVFLTKPRTVLTRDQLLDMAKGRGATPFDRSIDTHVSRLRRKLSDDARSPKLIKTVWGGGYIFTPEVIRE